MRTPEQAAKEILDELEQFQCLTYGYDRDREYRAENILARYLLLYAREVTATALMNTLTKSAHNSTVSKDHGQDRRKSYTYREHTS